MNLGDAAAEGRAVLHLAHQVGEEKQLAITGARDEGILGVAVVLVVACVMLWRANRAKPIAPDETVSENPTFGTVARPEPVPA